MKQHIPILVPEIISYIPHSARTIVDGTFWHAWHATTFVQRLKDTHHDWERYFYGFDKDSQVLEYGTKQLSSSHQSQSNISLINQSYADIHQHLASKSVDFILLDLWINWAHVTDDERWFSFQASWPLDMRFDQRSWFTAYQLIKSHTLQDISSWMKEYGDFSDKRSHHIAQAINAHKADKRLSTTTWLVEILQEEIGIRKPELAPLFQSLRIVTNKEFEEVKNFFKQLDTALAPGGRCAILSFHSIEDRLIKTSFKTLESTLGYTILTKKPIDPSHQEVLRNRASRSAKLRVIEKPTTLQENHLTTQS